MRSAYGNGAQLRANQDAILKKTYDIVTGMRQLKLDSKGNTVIQESLVPFQRGIGMACKVK